MAKIAIQVATAASDDKETKQAKKMVKTLKSLLGAAKAKSGLKILGVYSQYAGVVAQFDIGPTRGNLHASVNADGELIYVNGSTGNPDDGLNMQPVKGMNGAKNRSMTPEEAVTKLVKAVLDRNAGKTKVAKPAKDKRKPGFGYGKYKASDVRRLAKAAVEVGAPFAWVEQTTGEMSPGQLVKEVKPGVWFVQIGDPTSTPQPQHAVMRVSNMYAPMDVHGRALSNAEWRSTIKQVAREARGVDPSGFPKPTALPRKPAILD